MQKAAAKARELGKPWVLDPVGAGATSLRTKTATDLVLSYKPTVIRGNPSEIMALAKSVCKDLDVQASGIGIVDMKIRERSRVVVLYWYKPEGSGNMINN